MTVSNSRTEPKWLVNSPTRCVRSAMAFIATCRTETPATIICRRLKQAPAECSYVFHDLITTFRVVACPAYGELRLTSFETGRSV
jgi:hypothetical protein